MRSRLVAVLVLLLVVPFLPLAPSAAQAQAGGAWLEPGDGEQLPSGPDARHFRLHLTARVPEALRGVGDIPVTAVLDLAEHLAQAGYPHRLAAAGAELNGFELDPDSFTLHEVDADGNSLSQPPQRVPVMVTPGSLTGSEAFHAATNPVVTLRWILAGQSAGDRHYHLYFDATHNGPKTPATHSGLELDRLAAAVGPGRGTRLYVPLHDTISQVQGQQNEMRHVRITAPFEGTRIQVHEYKDNGLPEPGPTFDYTTTTAGDVRSYQFGNFGNQPSAGSVLINASLPVYAEALSVPPAQLNSFTPSFFLPALDGGQVGRQFGATPTTQETWNVYCHATNLPEGEQACQVRLDGGAPTEIPANTHAALQVGPQWTTLQSSAPVAVQRVGSGFAAWPALDGNDASRTLMGHAGQTDHLMLLMHGDERQCLLVKSLGPGNPLLSDKAAGKFCIQPGLTTEGSRWGTSWDRKWETDAEHRGGPARVEAFGGSASLTVISGDAPTDDDGFGALVALPSPDGGHTYRFHLPATTQGNHPIGQLVLFAPYAGTKIESPRESLPPLQADQRVVLRGAGDWEIHASRPVVVSWINPSTFKPFGGPVSGITDLVDVTVEGAHFVGAALDIEPVGKTVVQKKPGDVAAFSLWVTNRARSVEGAPPDDEPVLSLQTPWTPFDISTDHKGPLAAGQSMLVNVSLAIPDTDAESGGATLSLQAQSTTTPGLTVSQSLRINLVTRREVQVLADGQDVIAKQQLVGGNATYLVEVRNTGTARDAYAIDISQPNSLWVQQFEPVANATGDATLPLEPGGSALFRLTLGPAPDVTAASRLITNVVATSTRDRSVNDAVRIETSMATNRSIAVDVLDALRTVEPGTTTTFNVTLHNHADVNEELHVDIQSALPDGWSAPTGWWVDGNTRVGLDDVDNIVGMDMQSSTLLRIELAVPADAPPLQLGALRLRLQSLFDATSDGIDVPLRVLVDHLEGLDASLSGGDALIPGGTASWDLQLESTANHAQPITIRPLAPGGAAWSFRNENASHAPWNVTLAASQTESIRFHTDLPPDVLPSTGGKTILRVELAVPGMATRVLSLPVDVVERPAASAASGTVHVTPGQWTTVHVDVRNTGNTPLALVARWGGLPQHWDTTEASHDLPVGGRERLPLRLRAPADVQTGQDIPAQIIILPDEADATPLATSTWNATVGQPELVLELPEPEGNPVPDGRVYSFRLTNLGNAPAYNVSVELLDQDRVADRYLLAQVRPGAIHRVPLLGPDGGELSVRLAASHLPEVMESDQTLFGSASDQEAALPLWTVLLAALAALAATRRRSG